MFEFSKLCKAVEDMDPETASAVFREKSTAVITALETVGEGAGIPTYLNFILCAIAADGKLAEEEYIMVKPLLEMIAGRPVSFDDAKQLFKDAGLDRPADYKKAVDMMVDLLGILSEDLKADVITLCLLVCAIDGKISHKEKKWIKQLIE